jgi:Flp pilus assembly pilin Flp
MAGRDMVHRRRAAVVRRPHGTGLEYGLIAAALAVAIVTVVAGLGTRYGGTTANNGASMANAMDRNLR